MMYMLQLEVGVRNRSRYISCIRSRIVIGVDLDFLVSI